MNENQLKEKLVGFYNIFYVLLEKLHLTIKDLGKYLNRNAHRLIINEKYDEH